MGTHLGESGLGTERLLTGDRPRGQNSSCISAKCRDDDSDSYEELMDSQPCPTCRGLGRISKVESQQLVALIPVGDKRLKPRRTALYVGLAILVCVVIASLILFFLYPRNVLLLSNQPFLEPSFLHINKSADYVFFTITNQFNISNNNYVPVSFTGGSMNVMYDMRVLSKATNQSVISIPIRSMRKYYIQMNVTLEKDEGYLAIYCSDSRKWVHDLFMQFEFLANYSFLGHTQQATLTTYQHVSCGNDSTGRQ